MTFRDLSYWGIFKIIFIVNWAVPILLAPFIFLVWLANPSVIKYTPSSSAEVYGMTISHSGEGFEAFLNIIPLILTLGLIGMLIQTAILWSIGRFTPFGRIKLGARGAP